MSKRKLRKLPSTIKEAWALGYEIDGEDSDATGKESGAWHGEERREGRLLLRKLGRPHPWRLPDGRVVKVQGRLISEFVFPYTATLRFGKPRLRRKGEII